MMTGFAPSSDGLLAPLSRWLDDSSVSEILMNKPGEVYVEKNGALSVHKIPDLNEN